MNDLRKALAKISSGKYSLENCIEIANIALGELEIPDNIDYIDEISLSYVRSVFEYKDGDLYWTVDRLPKRIGDIAGYLKKDGYRYIKLKGRKYVAHRIIWLYHYGKWPDHQIDHINGNRSDNRIENLREVTSLGNSRNMKIPKSNTSGHIGVYWHKIDKKWMSQISIHGTKIYLGSFDSIDDAIAIRKEAEREHGFHENHGRLL